MSNSTNSNVMNDDSTQPKVSNLPTFTSYNNGQCPGSIAKRMRNFEKENDRNANAIWSEWVLPEFDTAEDF